MDDFNKTIIGKDVIESLTLGMYEDARIIYREYIQNSADQIDKAVALGILESIKEGSIWIEIDRNNRRIVIEDNATGIKSHEVTNVLKNIAQSTKQRGVDKGFRGIGRLGGLAYCDKLTFETSYQGESVRSIIKWDAKKLRHIINNRDTKETASDVIDEITSISTESEKNDNHFFKVILDNVTNDSLLDKQEIEDYLSMIAPTAMHPRFTFIRRINDFIREQRMFLDEYRISVNSEELFKAYTTKIYELAGNDRKSIDEVKDIQFFYKKSEIDKDLLLWGWFGVWSFSKQIPDKANPARGFRLRKSNIQIGDEHCLVKLHREPRGNFYYFGEVHAVHSKLIPNARRDYFLNNEYLEEFELYLTDYFKDLYSLYHLSSKIRSAQKDITRLSEIDEEIKIKKQVGFSSRSENDELFKKREEQLKRTEKAQKDLQKISETSSESEVKQRVFNELTKDFELIKLNGSSSEFIAEESDSDSGKDKIKIIFIDDNTLPRQSKEERKLIKKVFDVIADCLPDQAIVENIRLKIIEEFNKGKS